MPYVPEKRNSPRHPYECRIILLHTQGQPQDMEARLLNYSEQGVCFTSRHPLTPGTTIALRALGECYSDLAAGSKCLLRSTALAKVKWRRECTWMDPPAHAMGAAYLINY